ncbi:MAG: type II toxin-antitoxin system VapC family toxin [Candidatus Bathyarchaeia archaeon]|nr:type II toxin-antitoxin system VapC family toxin [Candidatus Bathyarchaeota archaeon]
MKLLDTSVIISILRGDEEIKDLVERLNEGRLCTTTITQFELFSRIYHKGLIKEGIIIKRFIKSLALLIFDEDSSDKAAQIMGSLLKAEKTVNVIDILIAGIALANGVEDIITKDGDFKVIEEVYGYPKVTLLR